jgi:antitoxin component YwqK of YwqJK toxin-antitoxin module
MPNFMKTRNLLTFTILLLFLFGCGRQIYKDEIVLNEMVIEKNGKYYYGDCEEHATKYYTGTNKYYHGNGKVKGTFTIKNGLPNGHWEQFNLDGSKKLDLYFEDGKLINKITH